MTDHIDINPPQDLQAEMALLGCCMHGPEPLRLVLEAITPGDYYRPLHGRLHALCAAMQSEGVPVDQRTLTDRAINSGLFNRVEAVTYVSRLFDAVPTAANTEWYITIVIDLAQRRGLIEAGTRAVQAGHAATDGTVTELIERAVGWFRELRDRETTNRVEAVDIHDFLAVKDHYNWLIPDLMERGDRLILTASEGGGKTTMIRQMAICGAAGIHPFTHVPVNPFKVLILDCENSEPMSRRALYPMAELAAKLGKPIERGRMAIRCKPAGLDLTHQRDRSWVLREVEAFMPDMLIIGPVYRLHAGNPNDEELARKVSAVVDEARATAGCAVIMEAHAPHGGPGAPRSLRPLGSSLWMRWPEFGYGLRPVDDEHEASINRMREVVPWRGARDQRDWPGYVRKGYPWPWEQTIYNIDSVKKPQGSSW